MIAFTGFEWAAIIFAVGCSFAVCVVALGWAAGYQEKHKRRR